MIVTPAELLLAIAEHEGLEATQKALPGLTRESAQSLLKGAAAQLKRAQQAELPMASQPAGTRQTPVPKAARPAARATGRASGTPPLLSSDDAPEAARPGMHTKLIVYSDGASRGNPGPAGAGAVLVDAQGTIVERLGKYLGSVTNNVAEYRGLLLGLARARELGAKEIEVRADSELMIRQLEGRYRVKHPAMQELFAEAQRLLAGFVKKKYVHVPREKNTDADEMSNRAIDEKM